MEKHKASKSTFKLIRRLKRRSKTPRVMVSRRRFNKLRKMGVTSRFRKRMLQPMG